MDISPQRRTSLSSSVYSPNSKSSLDTYNSSMKTRLSSYDTYRKYAGGGVSAFSSVADLKAHLRESELKREERMRVQCERKRYQQEQLQQEQLHKQGTECFQSERIHPWSNLVMVSPTRSTDELNQELHHKHINFVRSPNEADLILLSSQNNMKQNKMLPPIKEPNKYNEVRDETNFYNIGKMPKHHKLTIERPALEYVITPDTNDNDIDDNASETSDITNSGRRSLVSEVLAMPPTNTMTRSKTKQRKKSVAKPLKKMINKVWDKVKPLFTCKSKLFKRKEEAKLNRAKGNLC